MLNEKEGIMAILTADDIRYKRFSTARFKSGYNSDEVDDFLEEVIQTVEELGNNSGGEGSSIADQEAINTLNAQVKTYENDLTASKQEVSLLKTQLEAAQTSRTGSSSEIEDALRVQLNELATKLQETLDEVQDANQKANESEAKSISLEMKLSEAEVKSGEFGTKIEELEAKVSEAETKSRELEAKLSVAETDADNENETAQKLETALKEVSEKEESLKEVQEKLSTTEGQLEDTKSQLDATQESLRDVEKSLGESQERIKEVEEKLASAETAVPEEIVKQLASYKDELETANETISKLQEQIRIAEPPADTGSLQAIKDAAVDDSEESILSMITIAKELHDRYVQQGKETGANMIKAAEVKGNQVLAEAREISDATYAKLAKDRSVIERRIDELKAFEKDYRVRLRGFLNNTLKSLDTPDETS
ncbi:MAG: DivIVA domain-containing protein [Bifidobacteriaceae bacterium]|nr:DivIVA domain-containing protein [Bifidobacteriaceae bacterium]